jgi:hypothetical protein
MNYLWIVLELKEIRGISYLLCIQSQIGDIIELQV